MSALTGSIIAAMAGGLVAAAAWRLFRSRAMAALAAVIFVSSPIAVAGFAADARQLAAVLPWLAWLVAMLWSLERADARAAAIGGLAAAAGLYPGPAGLVTMPLLVLCGVAALFMRQPRPIAIRQAAWLAGAFVAAGLPLAFRMAADPSSLTQLIIHHGLYDASKYNPLQGLREIFSWVGLVARSEAYWNYYDPAVWFFSGSTLQSHLLDARVFFAPLVLPVAVGLYRLIVPLTAPSWLLLSGLAVAPVPHMMIARSIEPGRLLVAAPFVAIVAAAGCAYAIAAVRR